MTYREVEMNIIQWGEARGIVQNATAMSQAIKTLVCAVLNLDLVQCLNGAYNEIKDRKGYLTKEGVFVKEV